MLHNVVIAINIEIILFKNYFMLAGCTQLGAESYKFLFVS